MEEKGKRIEPELEKEKKAGMREGCNCTKNKWPAGIIVEIPTLKEELSYHLEMGRIKLYGCLKDMSFHGIL